jgi:hypothetical protein
MSGTHIPDALRDDLLTYLFCTSPDRARIIAKLMVRNPGIGDLLADLEADDDLRARLEIELLGRTSSVEGS